MIYVLTVIFGIAVDFFTKRWAAEVLAKTNGIDVIKNVFRFTYVENRGAAFGILQNRRFVFIALTLVILAVLIYLGLKNKNKSRFLNFGSAFVVSGALGNLADRIFLGYVVNFLDFCIINFPVFNVADCFVCVGAFMVAVYYIFIEKDFDDEQGQ